MTKEVSDINFDQEVLQSSIPVLVDFWAPWCGPCRALGPTIDALAQELEGKVKILKLNTDENPESAVRFRINSIPNLIFFKDGKPVDQLIGAVDKSKILDTIAKFANNS
ncbi:thioredoxin [Planctomyces bekefii]|jgi:thioredoxin 1|uniref:Thioredoxin n=1 Tax=Planctomyces bekefii TaxID=1653850 RepID=A0A5C6M6X0_9PLAN|nr:thioredoxin [Planctomyces bekefii]